ncbi:hypothetical protein BH23PSE1_BH23PSE1_12370 [soil metagenome]
MRQRRVHAAAGADGAEALRAVVDHLMAAFLAEEAG